MLIVYRNIFVWIMIVKFFNNRLRRILLNVPARQHRNGGSCMCRYMSTFLQWLIYLKFNKYDCMNKRIPDTELDYAHVILRTISLIISKGILNYTHTHARAHAHKKQFTSFLRWFMQRLRSFICIFKRNF